MANTIKQKCACGKRIHKTTGRDICYTCFYKTEEGKEARRRNLRNSRANRRKDSDAWSAETRRVNLWRNYKITPEEYDAQFEAQHGMCALCGIHQDDTGTFHVDHCHDTGQLRGLLCGECNLMLGKSKDNVSVLARSISYLTNGGVWNG